MNNNQISQGAHARVLSTVNRPLFWTRLFLLALFLAVSLASVQPRSSAQAANQARIAAVTGPEETFARNCPECWAAYQACQVSGDPSQCWVQYQICEANCH
jgi:hypothetical protein